MTILRLPTTEAESEALRTFIERVSPKATSAIASLKRGHRVDRAPWVGRIYEGPAGPEAVVVIQVSLKDGFVEADEKRADKALTDWMIFYGFHVGGVPCPAGHVWVRSAPLARAA